MWWCSWAVLWCIANVLKRRTIAKLKVHHDRRLRWSRLQFSRNHHPSFPLQTQIPWQNGPPQRKSLISKHHLHLRLLRLNRQKVRKPQRLVLLYWGIRLFTHRSCHLRKHILRSWRTFAQSYNNWPYALHRKKRVNTQLRASVWLYVVRSLGNWDMEGKLARGGMALWHEACWWVFT